MTTRARTNERHANALSGVMTGIHASCTKRERGKEWYGGGGQRFMCCQFAGKVSKGQVYPSRLAGHNTQTWRLVSQVKVLAARGVEKSGLDFTQARRPKNVPGLFKESG